MDSFDRADSRFHPKRANRTSNASQVASRLQDEDRLLNSNALGKREAESGIAQTDADHFKFASFRRGAKSHIFNIDRSFRI